MLTLENCLRGLSNGRRRNRHLSRGPGQARSIGYSRTNQSRWYDPSVGRWLSEDPSGLAAGDANLYRYCDNGPTDATDPTGLEERQQNSEGQEAAAVVAGARLGSVIGLDAVIGGGRELWRSKVTTLTATWKLGQDPEVVIAEQ